MSTETTELDRLEMVATARAGAQRSVELVPGRAAANVELSDEEVRALSAIMLEAAGAEYPERLESLGAPWPVYHRIITKLHYAERALADARR
jgi:hypothetical protein